MVAVAAASGSEGARSSGHTDAETGGVGVNDVNYGYFLACRINICLT